MAISQDQRSEFLKRKQELLLRKREVLMEKSAFNESKVDQIQSEPVIEEPSFLGGVAQAFTEERKAGQEASAEVSRQTQSGEIGIPTALAGQASAAKQQFVTPAVKALGEAVSPAVEPIVGGLGKLLGKITDITVGEEDKKAVSELFSSIAQSAKEKKESLSPAAQRNIESAVELGELPFEIAELLGIGAVSKVGKDVVQSGIKNIQKVQTLKREIEGIQSLSPTKSVRSTTEKVADQSIGSANRLLPTDKQEFVRISGGVDHGQWLNQRGIRGVPEDNVDTLGKRFVDNKNSLDDGMSEITGKHNPQSLSPVLDEAIELAEQVENKADLNVLAGVKRDIETSGGTTAKNIIAVKRIYERNNKFTYSKDLDAVKVQRATSRDNALREDLISIADDAGFTEFRAVSKEVQETRFLLDSIGKTLARDTSKEIFDVSDRILGGAAFVDPSTLLGIGAKKIITSNRFKSLVSKSLGGKTVDTPTVQINRIKDKAQRLEKEERKAGRKQAKETRAIKSEQETQAILADELSKKGIKVGKGFTLKDGSSITTINDKAKSQFLKTIKTKMQNFDLDPTEANDVAKLLKSEGFDNTAKKLNDYAESVEKGIEKEAILAIRSFGKSEIDEIAQSLSSRIKRMKAQDIDQLKDAKFRLQLEEIAESFNMTSDELFNLAKSI